MKIRCIHLSRRKDRDESFRKGVGAHCDFDYIEGIDFLAQPFVSDYFLCGGSLCCRAAHALAWVECLALGENVLVFEDDVLCDTPIDWAVVTAKVDGVTGNTVAYFDHRRDTHAYVVTTQSAATLLREHLATVNPVTKIQMSVDLRLAMLADLGWIDAKILEDVPHFYQHGKREDSDNDWNDPESLGVEIIYPTNPLPVASTNTTNKITPTTK